MQFINFNVSASGLGFALVEFILLLAYGPFWNINICTGLVPPLYLGSMLLKFL